MTRVLVTGGTSFVAGHVINELLRRGHSVVTTVRSQKKAQTIRDAFPGVSQENLDFAIVPDMAAKNAYDGLSAYGLEAAIHVASPFHYNVTDAKKDLLDPAVLGTTSVLEALHQNCPSVRRVVLTSSVAAILDIKLATAGAEKTYTEADWSPLTLEDAYSNPMYAYAASKVFAERAAWDFVSSNKPNFSLSTINPPMIFGPVKCPPKSLDSVNTSNELLAECISGKHKNGLPPTFVPLWIDVRDVAVAHAKALETEEAAGKRFFITAGHYSNAEIYRVLYDNFPELRNRLPDKASKGGDPSPVLQSFGYDTSQATRVLGLEWTPFEKSIIDSARSFL